MAMMTPAEIDRFLSDQRRADLIRALTRPGLRDDEIALIEHRYDAQDDEGNAITTETLLQ